jgi:hypothetical protein
MERIEELKIKENIIASKINLIKSGNENLRPSLTE